MKTVFISIYDGDTEKNILRTGVVSKLTEAGVRVVLLIRGKDRIEYYRKEFGSELVLVELLPPAATRAENIWYFIAWNVIPTRAVRVRQIRGRKKGGVARYAAGYVIWLLGHVRTFRELLRGIYSLSPDSYADELFKQYAPDLVFAPGMFSPEDCRILRAARKKGIPTVTMGKSWDVLTTKAFTRVKADTLLVFNEFNRDEAITYGDYDPKNIVITGFPQFDIYARGDGIVSREEFCASIGADPKKRIVMYGVPGDWKSPHSRAILAHLDDAVEQGKFTKDVQILARLHPKYSDTSEGMQAKHIIFDRPGRHFGDTKEFGIDAGVGATYQWTFAAGDIAHLVNTLYHSDVIINTDSTLTLDATAFDRPAIIIAYDGDARPPYLESIAFTYEREHYRNVVETGGAPLAKSREELIAEINHFLDDSEYLRAQRTTLREKMIYKTDGRSSERIANELLKQLV